MTRPPFTQHRAKVFLTNDLALEFTVFDHHNSAVPQAAWDEFTNGYRHAHGSDLDCTLTEYVLNSASWLWDTTYSSGTIAIGEADGPLALETDPDGPKGCRIMFWADGTGWDTGLRVWADEATIVAEQLRAVKERDARP